MDKDHTNRLIHEKSPYLLQHAHDPVDWYPWGEEAFEAAKAGDKPIFLSIGFATCHWCHVMEKESFENPAIAGLLNENFINISVDREEHPEVDNMYMEFAQALMSSGGGWPLNLILTPDLKPFFAMTYLPPENRKGMPGFKQVIEHVGKLWNSEEKELIFDQAERIVGAFKKAIMTQGNTLPTEDDYYNGFEVFFELVDPISGGLKGAPKFPFGYQSLLFLTYGKQMSESRALFFVSLTLDMMQRGGIYDHIGGGFSRYCIDDRWIFPHFEKMLYDNGFLATAYLEAGKCFENGERYWNIAKEILNYVLKEMTHPEGGFYSAEDSDSEGKEGFFYTWTRDEIVSSLSQEEAKIFCDFYGVTSVGNFEGKNILHATSSIEEFAEKMHMELDVVKSHLKNAKEKLFLKRQQRTPPLKDDKILSSWNGIMIDAFIRAASVFKDSRYKEAAIKAAEFIEKHLWKDGNLLRRFREHDARFLGGIDEYAYLIKGLISLFEEDAGIKWLKWAILLCKKLEKDFKSPSGAFYAAEEQAELLIRRCDFYDGAEPSGNAVHAENLMRLYQITQDISYLSQAEDILKAAKPFLEHFPPASAYHLLAFGRYLDVKSPTIIISLDEGESLKQELCDVFANHFLPHAVTVWKKEKDPLIDELLPNIKDKVPIDGQTAVYICYQNTCQPPLIHLEEIKKAIKNL